MKKATRLLVSLLLGLLILASIFWYLFIYDRAFTRDTLLSQARFQSLHGNSRLSSWFYDAAYSFSGHDENVAIELANQYKKGGNYTKAADISSDILAKLRHDMPEDDSRVPNVIADFIGDNVNDIAGNCSDLLESFAFAASSVLPIRLGDRKSVV